jgi:hypothetical protein
VHDAKHGGGGGDFKQGVSEHAVMFGATDRCSTDSPRLCF